MTSEDDGRKTEREDSDDDSQGRQTQREGGRDDWTPDAEKPQRKGDVTRGDPGEADAGAASDAPRDAAVEHHEGDVPEGGTDAYGDFEPPLETREYPVTTGELRKAYGEYRVDTDAGPKPLKELLEPADGETFGSADEVRGRIETLADR